MDKRAALVEGSLVVWFDAQTIEWLSDTNGCRMVVVRKEVSPP